MIAFTDGVALIVVIPSRSQNGVYLVRTEPQGDKLLVSHDCPAVQFGRECRHVTQAAAAYERFHWWEPKKKVIPRTGRIVLRSDWKQIDLPPSPEERIRELIADVS